MIDVVTLRKLKEVIDILGVNLSQEAVDSICLILYSECARLLEEQGEQNNE